jgi:serine/threonine protein kinase
MILRTQWAQTGPLFLSWYSLQYLVHVVWLDIRRFQDYHPRGDLRQGVRRNPSVYVNNLPYSKNLFLQIAEGVRECHDRNVYHRDLKLDNILLADLGSRAVIADFGLGTRHSYSTEFGEGSAPYMSPGEFRHSLLERSNCRTALQQRFGGNSIALSHMPHRQMTCGLLGSSSSSSW